MSTRRLQDCLRADTVASRHATKHAWCIGCFLAHVADPNAAVWKARVFLLMTWTDDHIHATLWATRNLVETSRAAVLSSTDSIAHARDTLERSSAAVAASRRLLDEVEVS